MARSFRASHFVVPSLLIGSLGLFATQASCSSDKPVVNGGTGTGTGTGSSDAGSDAGGNATFSPKGCSYSVTMTTLPQSDLSPSITPHANSSSGASPTSDPSVRNGVPSFVRRGLGGSVVAGGTGYADPTTSVAIGWQTDDPTTASRMLWGTSKDSLTNTQDGFSYSIESEETVTSTPTGGLRFHEVHLCGLNAGTTYYYKVGGGAAGKEQWSGVYSFTTAPAKTATDPVKIGFTGDTRPETLSATALPVWKTLSSRFAAAGVPIALFSGDIVYAGTFQNLWDTWLTSSQNESTSIFYALAPGNHENEDARFFAHAVMPGASTQNARRYASFDYGPAHIVMFDDYLGTIDAKDDDLGYAAEVKAWLDKDLSAAQANRANVPWIITFHHHPFYSSTDQDRAAERTKVIGAFQSIYDKYGVDVDLAGHDHFYERSFAVKAGAKDPKGTNYIIAGAGGASAYGSIPANNPFLQHNEQYDPSKGEGIYGIMTVSKASLRIDAYKLVSGATDPSGDHPIEDKTTGFTLTK